MKNQSSSLVGVIGLGSVGKVIYSVFSHFFECVPFDIKSNYPWGGIINTNICFICVPTPLSDNGRLDCSNVTNVIERLAESNYKGIIVIKSTISIGYMEGIEEKNPSLKIVYMPEFLREKSSFVWFANPDRLAISGKHSEVSKVLEYFYWVEDAEIIILDHRSAEIGKLAHNAFIATKISFTNEIELITKQLGGDPLKVMSVIWSDRRVKSQEHLTPLKGPYGGKCVPKDTIELINSSEESLLLKTVYEVNEKIKQIYGEQSEE